MRRLVRIDCFHGDTMLCRLSYRFPLLLSSCKITTTIIVNFQRCYDHCHHCFCKTLPVHLPEADCSGLFHFVYGASPQHILLHFPIKLLHLPIKFASFPQQIASFPQQFASFPQQIASFPQHSFSLPQHILCHFAKHRIKVFFCNLFIFSPFLDVLRQLYW